jgi:hypothetical protein
LESTEPEEEAELKAGIESIAAESTRGAELIAGLAVDLAQRTAEVTRCRGEVIVAGRVAELLRLRRGAGEASGDIEERIARLRGRLREPPL